MQNTFNTSASDPTEQLLRELGVDFKRQPDGTLVVPGNLNLSSQEMTELPDLSSIIIKGYFSCSNNQLTSLKGAPQTVGRDFLCSGNQLASLEHAPQSVGGDFYCTNNRLTSLKGAPQTVGGSFHCDRNQLTSLEGAPQSVGWSFHCDRNRLMSLKGAPQSIGADFYCHDNQLTSLEGAPQSVGGSFYCFNNQFTFLEGAPHKFRILWSDSGKFSSWEEVPERLRISPETKARPEQEKARQRESAAAIQQRLQRHADKVPRIKKL